MVHWRLPIKLTLTHISVMRPPWILLKLMVFNNKKFLECIHQESGELWRLNRQWTQWVHSRSFLLENIDNITQDPGQNLNIFRWLEFYIETFLQCLWIISKFTGNLGLFIGKNKTYNTRCLMNFWNSKFCYQLSFTPPVDWLIIIGMGPPKNNEPRLVRFHHEKMEYITFYTFWVLIPSYESAWKHF